MSRIYNKIKSGMRFVFDSDFRFLYKSARGDYTKMDDAEYIRRLYKARVGKTLDLENPKRFTEKLQWLKLYCHRSEFTNMADKCEGKRIIENLLGPEYVIPTIGVYDSVDQIDFETLPNQFVLKCTHDSGSVIICENKDQTDLEGLKQKLREGLCRDFYSSKREWVYKNIKPRIIAEKFIKTDKSESLDVYKVFCFSGEAFLIQVVQNDKKENESIDYFDTKWQLLDCRQNFPNSEQHLKRPKSLSEMIKLSENLSKGIPFLRVDWYEINDKPVFSEFTFYSDAGFERFYPDEWDYRLGDLIELPAEKII